MAATYEATSIEQQGEVQALVIKQCEKVAMPSIDAQLLDLSSMATPITTEAAKLVDLSSVAIPTTTTITATAIVLPVGDYKFLMWEKSLSLGRMWLRNVVDFFGQQFYNYIAGLSEKMEKLEYY